MNKKELEERLIDFSVKIIDICAHLTKSKASGIIEGQIIRSGTSCTLNYGEAIGAESSKDFLHKIQIVLKELRETYLGLRILKKAALCELQPLLDNGIDENNQLIGIFVKSVNTLRNS